MIPEEFETSIEIFSRVLQRYGIGRHVIEGEIEKIRNQGYEMLRSPSLPQARIAKLNKALKSAETEAICVPPDSPIAGKTLGGLRLRTITGASVIAITRGTETEINPDIDFVIQPEDLLLLVGTPENLDRAIALINGTSHNSDSIRKFQVSDAAISLNRLRVSLMFANGSAWAWVLLVKSTAIIFLVGSIQSDVPVNPRCPKEPGSSVADAVQSGVDAIWNESERCSFRPGVLFCVIIPRVTSSRRRLKPETNCNAITFRSSTVEKSPA